MQNKMNRTKDKICSKFEQLITNSLEKDLFYLYFFGKIMHELDRASKVNRAINFFDLNKISSPKIYQYKSSDTIFIMGSGSSINKLTNKEWNEIKKNDSIGLNFWLIHDFVPTYYMFELSGKTQREKIFLDILNQKSSYYINIPFIVRNAHLMFKKTNKKELDLSIFPDHIKSNFFMAYELPIPGTNKENLEKSLKIINRILMNNKNCFQNWLLSKRASLSEAIYFAFKMGYRKIILCGIDLNNTKYFYEENSYYSNKFVLPPKAQGGQIHKTLDSTYGLITIDLVISKINQLLLKPNEVNLYIGSKQSALYPKLPYYFE